MRSYYNEHKFTHPRRADFESLATAYIQQHTEPAKANALVGFLVDCLDSSKTIDFLVDRVEGKQAELKRNGDLFLPVSVEVAFTDGTISTLEWNDNTDVKQLSFEKDIQSIEIDPDRKCYIDLNVINNSYVKEKGFFKRYFLKSMTWAQHLLQSTTFLI